MSAAFARGTVWLVGAGPGDPDLLTRKAERLIAAADIVFHDALVGPGVLALVPPSVELVSVGKRSGRHSKDQRTIDMLIVEAALVGKRVVRLKGGDPSIFGRSNEELEACHAAGVPVHICPGITAASAAAADLGLSLTLRGTARRLARASSRMDSPDVMFARVTGLTHIMSASVERRISPGSIVPRSPSSRTIAASESLNELACANRSPSRQPKLWPFSVLRT